MITPILHSSRRHFLERFAIASTVLAVSPTVLMGKDFKKMLSIAVLGNDSILSTMVEESDNMMITHEPKMADVIYVRDSNKINLRQALMSRKHLIIERNENSDSMIEKCQELGILLAVVERSEDGMKLFDMVDYYESKLSQSFDLQKVMTKLDFLVRNTQNDKFRIFSL
jgi:hypothetical protein